MKSLQPCTEFGQFSACPRESVHIKSQICAKFTSKLLKSVADKKTSRLRLSEHLVLYYSGLELIKSGNK